MDVIHPSGRTAPVPLMLQITSTKDLGKWINQRAYYIYGLLTTGYAGAIMDYNGGQRVSPVGRVFPEKRAARLLRANAKKWNLSGKLGVTGHSKGSSRAAKAAFINEAKWEDDPGPHAEQSARFQVVLASAGQHAKEFLIEDGYLDEVSQAKRESALRQQKEESVEEIRINSTYAYVTADDPPAFLCVGELDKKFRVGQMKRLAAQCEKVGLEHRFIIQKGMDHMYIPDPEVIGEIFSFFDRHLKTEFADVEDLPLQKGLPDPFLMPDGKRVQTFLDWRKQREYHKAMLAHYLYGHMPPRPKEIEIRQVGSELIYDGRGVEEQYTLTIRRKGKSVMCRFLIVRPSLKKRYPTIIKNDRVSFDASPERSDLSQSFGPRLIRCIAGAQRFVSKFRSRIRSRQTRLPPLPVPSHGFGVRRPGSRPRSRRLSSLSGIRLGRPCRLGLGTRCGAGRTGSIGRGRYEQGGCDRPLARRQGGLVRRHL